MKDGVYLLVLPQDDYGIPVVLKNQTNPDGTPFEMIVGVNGVKLVINLPDGYKLIPMLIMTDARLAALRYLTKELAEYASVNDLAGEYGQHMSTLALCLMDIGVLQDRE